MPKSLCSLSFAGNSYIAGSVDGGTYSDVLRWTKHRGANTAYLHTNFAGAMSGFDKYVMDLDSSKAYRSFRPHIILSSTYHPFVHISSSILNAES